MAKKIIFFNHKGGVSKTTSCFNIGWMLASKGARVLLVDADPQCNLSGLFLDDFNRYYDDPATRNQNIKDGVSPAFDGKPTAIQAVDCPVATNNKNLWLLAGHANLSEYDASLSFAQTSNNAITTLQNLPGAFNRLVEATSQKYAIEFVLIDLNPGLSGINQNLFMLSDYFIIPTNPDPFSVMAIETLSSVLPRWMNWAIQARQYFQTATYPLPNTTPQLLGTLIQRFNIRRGKAAGPYKNSIADIKETVSTVLVPSLQKNGMMLPKEKYQEIGITDNYCIEEVPDFQSLIQKAQFNGVPVFELTDQQLDASGPVLDGLKASRDRFKQLFSNIVDKIIFLTK